MLKKILPGKVLIFHWYSQLLFIGRILHLYWLPSFPTEKTFSAGLNTAVLQSRSAACLQPYSLPKDCKIERGRNKLGLSLVSRVECSKVPRGFGHHKENEWKLASTFPMWLCKLHFQACFHLSSFCLQLRLLIICRPQSTLLKFFPAGSLHNVYISLLAG